MALASVLIVESEGGGCPLCKGFARWMSWHQGFAGIELAGGVGDHCG